MNGELTVQAIEANLNNPVWRLNNLYKIIIKGDDSDDDEGLVSGFVMNRAQRRFMARLHNRNVILKARQMGFTTLICILWLDTAIFTKAPVRCAIIAQDMEAAESIFRSKVLFGYNQLPEIIRDRYKLKKETQSELEFAHNNATIKVATSVRSGTIHRLHVSEFGKICAESPKKAKEIVTGSFPAVPLSGLLVVESTAEGQEGSFFKITKQAQALYDKRATLSPKDFQFHFYAWWQAPEYRLTDPRMLTPSDHEYFKRVESIIGFKLENEQMWWYVNTRDSDFGGDPTLMWQEYPSYPDEAFQQSTEGCWFSEQLSAARRQGRIVERLPDVPLPVNTFWDVGRSDMTAIWLHMKVGTENRFIKYYENSGEDLIHYAQWLQQQNLVYGKHYLPHECEHKRMGSTPDTNRSIKEMLEQLMPGQRFEIVPRVTHKIQGIQSTRNVFGTCWFDETHCKQGLKRLANYKKVWNKMLGVWKSEVLHDENSHGGDAFLQFGQSADNGDNFVANVAADKRGTTRRFRRRGSPQAL